MLLVARLQQSRMLDQSAVAKALHEIVPICQHASDVLVHSRPVLWSDIGGLWQVKAQVKQVASFVCTCIVGYCLPATLTKIPT